MLHIGINKNAAGDANAQTQQVDGTVYFISAKITEGGFEIVFEHRPELMGL
jgi:hypothetical protein